MATKTNNDQADGGVDFSETFNGWVFTGVLEEGEEYKQDGPTRLKDNDQLYAYLVNNVPRYPEIRIVDGGDMTVMHIVRQRLLFPLPDGVTEPPVWDIKRGAFV